MKWYGLHGLIVIQDYRLPQQAVFLLTIGMWRVQFLCINSLNHCALTLCGKLSQDCVRNCCRVSPKDCRRSFYTWFEPRRNSYKTASMPILSERHRIFTALFVLGCFSQVAQALLIRECLVAFYGNEVSLGAFFASWLVWIAIGSLLAVRTWRGGQGPGPQRLLGALLLALPLLLALQILLTRVSRLLLAISATEFIPLGELFLAVLLITLPTGLVIGLAYPLACKALEQTETAVAGALDRTISNVTRIYVLESLGALLGGVLFTLAMVEGLGVWRSLGLTGALLACAAMLLGYRRGWGRLLPLLLLLFGMVTAVTPFGGWLEESGERLRFSIIQPDLKLLDSVETRYGHVALAGHGEQKTIVIDGRLAESFPATDEVRLQAAYLNAQAPGAKRILIFGGLAGGLAEELLRYPVQSITLVEQDRRAFEMLRPHLMPSTLRALADPRLQLRLIDGRRFVNTLETVADYDLVLMLSAVPSSADSNRYFTLEFYRRLAQGMARDGVLCTSISSASNYLGSEVKSYSGSVLRTLTAVFPQVAIQPGDEHLYCASRALGRVSEKPAVLEARYKAVELPEPKEPPEVFYSLLPAERIAFVRQQLAEQGGELNLDSRPITYYFNMILWGKFSASQIVTWMEALRGMGFWPYLTPLLVFAGLLMLRGSWEAWPRQRLQRHAAVYTLTLLGMVAMAAQLALLFAYQAHVGFIFSRVALLNGLFMTGLALGAVLGQRLARSRRPDLKLAALMLLTALAMALLPALIARLAGLDLPMQEASYLLLSFVVGLLTGTGFPLGLRQAQLDTGEVLRSSGLVEAADDLGGALGGLITGALLVPLLGIEGTCRLLALCALIAPPLLLHAHFVPLHLPALQLRGLPSLPWPRLSWGLLFLVLCTGLLSLTARSTAPGPQVKFSDELLRETSGSRTFELREQPAPHYLGRTDTHAETVSLATQPVAGDVRGYAGPINLLVAVDRSGKLRGVRYLESKETPSYIAGIESWLAGLSGRELASEPLTLDNVDALSGATVSSRAALESINQGVRAGGKMAFGKLFAAETKSAETPFWRDTRFLLTLLLLLAVFPVYLSGRDGPRLALQLASLLVLGFWFNTLFTEIDLINLSQGHVSSWASNPQRWLLLGFVLLSAVLLGPVWCGFVCPFGVLQELLSRLGRRLYLRRYVDHELESRARYLKYLLLALLLTVVWISGDSTWAGFDPMQHIFAGHWAGHLSGWIGAIILLSLAGSLFYVRFWCRYLCPVGAFLALFNKLALLTRFGPQRRFEHCDLGVRSEYDIDCIRCQRCISGRDYGVRHHSKGSVKTTRASG